MLDDDNDSGGSDSGLITVDDNDYSYFVYVHNYNRSNGIGCGGERGSSRWSGGGCNLSLMMELIILKICQSNIIACF